MSPTVQILGQTYYWYDLINAFVAIPAFGVYIFIALRSLGISTARIWVFFVLGYAVQYFGGWILPILYRMERVGQSPWIYSIAAPPGRFFHSVVVSYLLYTLAICWLWKWPVRKVLDKWIVGVMMVSAIARFGCLIQGCCYGKPTTLPWPFGVHNRMPLEVARHPTQAYMILIESALTLGLWLYGRRKHPDGEVFWLGVLFYSIYRFLIEFLRTNMVYAWGLTHAQLFSAAGSFLAIYVLAALRRKHAP